MSQNTRVTTYSIGHAAMLLGVSVQTLRKYADTGKIDCYRYDKHRRFAEEHIQAYLLRSVFNVTNT